MSLPNASMESISEDVEIFSVQQLLPKLKNASLFLGVMYFISFLLLLPFWLSLRKEISAEMGLLLLAVASIVIVHLFLNWSYYGLVMLPALGSIALFMVGALLWIFSPLLVIPFQLLFSMFIGVGGGIPEMVAGNFMKSLSEVFKSLGDVISRLGQFLMIIAGWFWWLNDKLRNINHKALGFYLLCLIVYGFLSGMSSLQGVIVFLYIWLWIKFRLEEKEDLPSLSIIFKIVATILIILKISMLGKFDLSYALYGSKGNNVELFLVLYRLLLTGGLLAFVWKYEWLIKMLPERFSNFLLFGDAFLKLRSGKSAQS